MKYLIAGLGNPGPEYRDTRHNAGFMVADELAARKEAAFESARYADMAKFRHAGRQFVVIKPMTYINLSGNAIRYWMEKEKISAGNLLVIIDDLSLPFGTLRMRAKGSDGGHNGLKDIQAKIGTTNYPRLRFGIGSEFSRGMQVDYVLAPFSGEEAAKLPELIGRAADMALAFGTMGIAQAMSKYNG